MHSPISNAGRGSCELPHNSLMILSNFANRGGGGKLARPASFASPSRFLHSSPLRWPVMCSPFA